MVGSTSCCTTCPSRPSWRLFQHLLERNLAEPKPDSDSQYASSRKAIPPSSPLSGVPTREGSRTLGLQPRRPRAEAPGVQICASCTTKHINCNMPASWATSRPCTTSKPLTAAFKGRTAGAGLGPSQWQPPGGASRAYSFRKCLRRAGGLYRRRCGHISHPRHSHRCSLRQCPTGGCGSGGSDGCGPVIPRVVARPATCHPRSPSVMAAAAAPLLSLPGRSAHLEPREPSRYGPETVRPLDAAPPLKRAGSVAGAACCAWLTCAASGSDSSLPCSDPIPLPPEVAAVAVCLSGACLATLHRPGAPCDHRTDPVTQKPLDATPHFSLCSHPTWPSRVVFWHLSEQFRPMIN